MVQKQKKTNNNIIIITKNIKAIIIGCYEYYLYVYIIHIYIDRYR